MSTGIRYPYPGLRAFYRSESDLFFGRERYVNAMIERFAATRFLVVLGASGGGKSSLVRTGFADALDLGLHPTAGSRWKIADMHPGSRPMRELAAALLQTRPEAGDVELLTAYLARGPRSLIEWAAAGNLEPGWNLLLMVDQFEELFRYGDYAQKEEAEAFAALLLETAAEQHPNLHVVITMRSEYLGACALIPGLPERMNGGLYLTPRMNREECKAAIQGPAGVIGFTVEPFLVNRLLNDLARFAPWDAGEAVDQAERLSRQADQLPVMQHVLNRLWVRANALAKDGRVVLTLNDYEGIGGLSGALDLHGAEIMKDLGPQHARLVQDVFRGLVGGPSVAVAVRRPCRLGDLIQATGAPREDVVTILEAFCAPGCNFLRSSSGSLRNDDAIIDISHESLIRQWTPLRKWVEQEVTDTDAWRRLVAAQERHKRGEGDLLSGADLRTFAAWWDAAQLTPGWAKRHGGDFEAAKSYLATSRKRADDLVAADRKGRSGKRVGAFVIDALLGYVALFFSAVALTIADTTALNRMDDTVKFLAVVVWLPLWFLIPDLFRESVGKKLLGLTILDRSGGRPQKSQLLLRNCLYTGSVLCGCIFLYGTEVRYWSTDGLTGSVGLGLIALPFILEIVMLLATGNRLGDRLAGTMVLKKSAQPGLQPAQSDQKKRRYGGKAVVVLLVLAFLGLAPQWLWLHSPARLLPLAQDLKDQGKFDEAAGLMDQVLDRSPNDVDTLFSSAFIHQERLFQFERANALYARVIEQKGSLATSQDWANHVETDLTTARWDDCLNEGQKHTNRKDEPRYALILASIQFACSTGAGKTKEALPYGQSVRELLRDTSVGGWRYGGTKHFVSMHPAFAQHAKDWVLLFDALEDKDQSGTRAALRALGVPDQSPIGTIEDEGRWREVSASLEAKLKNSPNDLDALGSAASVYHERLFQFDRAFALYGQRNRLTGGTTATPYWMVYAEAGLTLGRWEECLDVAKSHYPQDNAQYEVIMTSLQFACATGSGNTTEALTFGKTLRDQLKEPWIENWGFPGTKQFVSTNPAFAKHAGDWVRLFDALEGNDKAGARAALRSLGVPD